MAARKERTRVSGKFMPFYIATQVGAGKYGGLFANDSGVAVQTNKTSANLTLANLFGSASRPALIGAEYNEWYVHSLTFELVPFAVGSATDGVADSVIAYNEDPNEAAQLDATGLSASTYLRILEETQSEYIVPPSTFTNTDNKSRLRFRPKTGSQWLFIQRNSETTAATNRQTSAGSLIVINDNVATSVARTNWYVICHYDISFRGRQYSQSISAFLKPAPVVVVNQADLDDSKRDEEFQLVKLTKIKK